MIEEVKTIQVFLDSEAFGYETFEYLTIDEAIAGIKRIWSKCGKIGDGIERRIGVVVNPMEDDDED